MNKRLVTFIFGTRPEAIKLAPIIFAFNKSKIFKTRIVITGQHKEMLKQVMDLFKLKANKNLNIMIKNQTLNYINSSIINELDKEFDKYYPSLCVVQGDTTSAMASSVAAFNKKIPIAHVEAGLRTNDLDQPFPEEANRRIISQLSTIHFAPTEIAKENLEKSNIIGDIFVTGNSVIDSLLFASNQINSKSINLHKIDLKENKIILATIHRRENIGDNLVNIAKALIKIVKVNKNVYIFLPLHKNELVRLTLKEHLYSHPKIILSEPLNYIEMVSILKDCNFLLTDSGGLQEEAPIFNKPVLILRESTERPEGLEAGTAKIIGTKTDDIFREANLLIKNEKMYMKMSKAQNPFGDGKTSERILSVCEKFIKKLDLL